MSGPVVKSEQFDISAYQKLSCSDKVTKVEKALLRRYAKRKYNGNLRDVQYDFGTNWRTLGVGRLYAEGKIGLQGFSREVRSALAQKYYWDIDVVGAQPTLCITIAKNANIPVPALEKFVSNRESILKIICDKQGLTRDEAKEITSSVLMGKWSDADDILPSVHSELLLIQQYVTKEKPTWAQKAIKDNKYNPKATVLSFYLQEQERLVLKALEAFLLSKGRTLDVYIHDGGLMRRLDGEIEPPLELLVPASDYVFLMTGYRVQFQFKPLVHSFEFLDNEVYIDASVKVNDRYGAKRLVELGGDSILRVGSTVYVIDPDTERWTSNEDSIRLFISSFADQLLFKQEAPGPLGFVTIDYGGTEKNISSLIKQLKTQAKVGTVPLLFDYTFQEPVEEVEEYLQAFKTILTLISNNDDILYQYLLKYLAHALQKPYELPCVSLVLIGDKGCGKDFIFDFLGKYVFGDQYYANYNNNNQFVSRQDIGRMNKFLVKLEEANRKICMENADLIKSLITSPTLSYDPKYSVNSVSLPNYIRYVFTTNNECPFDLSDKERRFVLFKCSSEQVGKIDFWSEIRQVLSTKEAGRAVADYLLSVDLQGFQVIKQPTNDYQDAVFDTAKSMEERFVDAWSGIRTESAEMYRLYRVFCEENGIALASIPTWPAFVRRLLKSIGGKKVLKRESNGKTFYVKPEQENTFQGTEA